VLVGPHASRHPAECETVCVQVSCAAEPQVGVPEEERAPRRDPNTGQVEWGDSAGWHRGTPPGGSRRAPGH
jgi:hypothetical protein